MTAPGPSRPRPPAHRIVGGVLLGVSVLVVVVAVLFPGRDAYHPLVSLVLVAPLALPVAIVAWIVIGVGDRRRRRRARERDADTDDVFR